MAAVLHYENQSGEMLARSWKVDKPFNAIIKCFVTEKGKLNVIEKPSTRPASFVECQAFAKKMISQYGDKLQQIIVWNLDEMDMES
ncbi:hypothetical protein [Niallia sp. 03190]|uniref:hypothetical protein n=1 Tax=Niallia sp. 03190 TaxID=3458061 RepID=UPI004044B2A2